MMMPKILNCPKCGEKYMAEDAEGPCPVCGAEHVVTLNCSKCGEEFVAHDVGAPCPVCLARKEAERAVTYAMTCPGCGGKEFAGGRFTCPVCQDNGYIFGIKKLSD